MLILPLTVPLVEAVLANLTPEGRAELAALPGAGLGAEGLVGRARFGAVFATPDGVPAAAIAAVAEDWPGQAPGTLWTLCSLGTTAWLAGPRRLEVGAAVTRWCRETLLPAIVAAGGLRAQVWVALAADGSHPAHRWLTRLLGARPETILPRGGANGADLRCYAWDEESLHAVRLLEPEAAEDRDAAAAAGGRSRQERRRDRGGRGGEEAGAPGGGLQLDGVDRRGGPAGAGERGPGDAAGADVVKVHPQREAA